MNGFRVTLLILLTLAVAALLGVVTIFQSNQEANYEAYLASVKASERQQLIAAHQDKMRRIGPQEENGPGSAALLAAQNDQQQQVTEAEERNVLASAERKDAAKVEEEATAEASAPKPLGLVTTINQEWGFIMVKPVTDEPMPAGMIVAIRRAGNIICEAELGEEEDGEQPGEKLISATIREAQFNQGADAVSADKFTPQVGDEVIISPYLSSSELRSSDASLLPAGMPPAPAEAPLPAAEGLQEVPAPLVPVP